MKRKSVSKAKPAGKSKAKPVKVVGGKEPPIVSKLNKSDGPTTIGQYMAIKNAEIARANELDQKEWEAEKSKLLDQEGYSQTLDDFMKRVMIFKRNNSQNKYLEYLLKQQDRYGTALTFYTKWGGFGASGPVTAAHYENLTDVYRDIYELISQELEEVSEDADGLTQRERIIVKMYEFKYNNKPALTATALREEGGQGLYTKWLDLRENPRSEPIRDPAKVHELEQAAKVLNGEAQKQILKDIEKLKSS